MKNLIIIISFALFTFSMNAQTIGTFTTTVEGGVKGTATQIIPSIELYNLNNKNTDNTLLFDKVIAEAGKSINFTITSNNDDSEFGNFSNILASSQNHLLRVGHTINGVKSNNAATLTGWFGDNANFLGKNVTSVTVTINNLKFETTDNWTKFSYEMVVTISGTDTNVAKVSDK